MLDSSSSGVSTASRLKRRCPIVAFDHEESRVGGAANVAANVAGARRAGASRRTRRARTRRPSHCAPGSTAHGIALGWTAHRPERRTTTKMRVVTTRNQQVARVDYETDREAQRRHRRRRSSMRAAALVGTVQAIVVSDYLKGDGHARAGGAPRRARTGPRRAAARRSEDPAPRLLRGRHARHTEPPRGGDRHAPAHPAERPTRGRLRARSATAPARPACSSRAASTACGCSTILQRGTCRPPRAKWRM